MAARYAWVLAGLLALGLGARAGAEQRDPAEEELDLIVLKDAGVKRYTLITKDDYVAVEGKYRGLPTREESFRVREVAYGRSPDYKSALYFRDRGRLSAAARDFLLALKNDKKLPWVQEHCNRGAAECLYELRYFWGYRGETMAYEPPSVYYRETLKANPKSRFLLDSYAKLVYCLAQERKFDKAGEALAEAEEALKRYAQDTAKLGEKRYREAADSAEALLRLADGLCLERSADEARESGKSTDYKPAFDAYAKVLVLAGAKYPQIYNEALAAQLGVWVKKREFAEAFKAAGKLIDAYREKSDTNLLPVLPAVYTVLGRANYEMAREEESRNRALQANQRYFEARLNYLHVIVEFFDRDEFLPEAYYYAGVCTEKLTMPNSKLLLLKDPDEKKQQDRDREVAALAKNGYELDGIEKASHLYRQVLLNYAPSPNRKVIPDPKAINYAELSRQGLKRMGVPEPGAAAAKP